VIEEVAIRVEGNWFEMLGVSASAYGAGEAKGDTTPFVDRLPHPQAWRGSSWPLCATYLRGVWAVSLGFGCFVGMGKCCKRSASHFNWQSLAVTRDSKAVNSGQH
jgi:hypothetical protein